jgi:SET and MYND domain-containing protein 4
MLHFNAHEIEELQKAESQKANVYKFKPIAVGVYPVISLFNHECHQGVGRYFVGKKMVMKALKPIAQGGMIPENYGPVFTKRTKYARQRTLRSRYWFRCDCLACTEIWPNLEQMPQDMKPIFR